MPAASPHMARLGGWTVLLLATLICVASPGCVRRRLTVRTTPPGALVYIDDQRIGFTPVSTPFTYYGTRKIQLVRDGYETVTVHQNFTPPWYEIPPLDFVSENLWPYETRDERVLDFVLTPQQLVPVDQLRSRAEQLRSQARQGFAAPLGPPTLLGPPPVFGPPAPAPGPPPP